VSLFDKEFFIRLLVVLLTGVAVTILSSIGLLYRRYLMFNFIFTVFSFSILGFITGWLMSDSREPAVTAVLPATLTLLGGVGAFIVGSREADKQSIISAIILCFGLSLFIGSNYGSSIRNEILFKYSDREELRNSLELASDIDRLRDYAKVVRLKKAYEETDHLDVSKFASYFEVDSKQEKEGDKKDEKKPNEGSKQSEEKKAPTRIEEKSTEP
jgi:hypothetical protein